jgi:serine/threonine protein kinase
VLYFMATGHPPFRAVGTLAVLHRICREDHRPVWQLNKDIPDELCDIIDNLLEKKPSWRPATADEVQQQLSQLLSRAQQRGLGRRRWRRWNGRRLRRRVAWVAAAITITASIIGGAMWFGPTAETATNQNEVASTESPRKDNAIFEAGQIERDVKNGFQELEIAINNISQSSHFVHDTDRWNREVQSVQHAVQQLESALRVPTPNEIEGAATGNIKRHEE